MTIRNDGIIVRQLFLLIEKEKYDKRLLDLLSETVDKSWYQDSCGGGDTSLHIQFKNGIQAAIFKNLDHNNLYLSDELFYMDSETSDSKISDDRLLLYLNNIGQYKYGH
jgi:hypothetical protein